MSSTLGNENSQPVEASAAEEVTDRAEAEAARRREVLRKAGAWAAAAPIMLALFDPTPADAGCDDNCDFESF